MAVRLRQNDLEETIFHESIHAAFDVSFANSADWQAAQDEDGAFITQYAADNPTQEDLAETGLFVYTLLTNPARLSTDIEEWMRENMSSRIQFFISIFP